MRWLIFAPPVTLLHFTCRMFCKRSATAFFRTLLSMTSWWINVMIKLKAFRMLKSAWRFALNRHLYALQSLSSIPHASCALHAEHNSSLNQMHNYSTPKHLAVMFQPHGNCVFFELIQIALKMKTAGLPMIITLSFLNVLNGVMVMEKFHSFKEARIVDYQK